MLTFAVQTNIGYLREENQDRVDARTYEDRILALVCDGMGGERSGSEASRLAAEVFFEHFEESYQTNMDPYAIRALLLSSVSAANSIIYTTAKMNYQNFGMGTTCVAAFLSDNGIAVVNVGDSRAYLYQSGQLTQLTKDHNVVNLLLDQGEIQPEEAKTHPQRHMLTRAVGVERTVRPDYFEIHPDGAFKLLLCSDGLSGYCEEEEIQQILEQDLEAEALADRLIALALEKGGRDNVSVAVVTES